MKIKEITLHNFAKYDAVTVSFDDNVTYLIGKNGAGKSTIGVNAIQFIMQGIAEKASGGNQPLIGERFRFIGPKGATAKGTIIFYDEKLGTEVKVTRKLTKSGSELSFEAPEGYELNQQWLNELFNIFLIAPKRFLELTAKEQAKALGIDTKQFDERIAELKKDYTETNAVYRSFGELLEVEKVERVDVSVLQAQKKAIADKLNALYLENKKANEATKKEWEDKCWVIDKECTAFNNLQHQLETKINIAFTALNTLKNHGYNGNEVDEWIASLGKVEDMRNSEDFYPERPEYIQELPDRAELDAIDTQIIAAGETNNKALLYDQYLEQKTKKGVAETALKTNKDKQATTESERLEYIKAFKFPFSNLTVGDDGELLLNGKPIKAEYFSTGELLKIIPVLIATTQPELKYVFLQDFNLMDEDKQKEIEEYLTGKGFQLVVEVVGKKKVEDKNCILLRDNCVVENYEEVTKNEMPI